MFSDFWEWLLIVLALILIFGADNLHNWKNEALKKLESFKKADENKSKDNVVKLKDKSSKE